MITLIAEEGFLCNFLHSMAAGKRCHKQGIEGDGCLHGFSPFRPFAHRFVRTMTVRKFYRKETSRTKKAGTESAPTSGRVGGVGFARPGVPATADMTDREAFHNCHQHDKLTKGTRIIVYNGRVKMSLVLAGRQLFPHDQSWPLIFLSNLLIFIFA